MKWETVIGLEVHAQLQHALEDLLGRVDGVRRGAEHAGVAPWTSRCRACCRC